jgi:hypothetical protein
MAGRTVDKSPHAGNVTKSLDSHSKNPNPLIDSEPIGTLDNIDSVLAFLQHQCAGSWDYEAGDDVKAGALLIHRTVRTAADSLQAHLSELHQRRLKEIEQDAALVGARRG